MLARLGIVPRARQQSTQTSAVCFVHVRRPLCRQLRSAAARHERGALHKRVRLLATARHTPRRWAALRMRAAPRVPHAFQHASSDESQRERQRGQHHKLSESELRGLMKRCTEAATRLQAVTRLSSYEGVRVAVTAAVRCWKSPTSEGAKQAGATSATAGSTRRGRFAVEASGSTAGSARHAEQAVGSCESCRGADRAEHAEHG